MRRAAAVVVTVLLLTTFVAMPAHAREPGIFVSGSTPTVQLHRFARPFQINVENRQSVAATNVTVRIDTSQVDSRVRILGPALEAQCPRSGAVYTCHTPSIPAGQIVQFEFNAAANESAAVGPAGSIVATLISGEPNANPGTSTVLPVEVIPTPSTDLAASTARVVAAIGDTVLVPVKVTNLGPLLARAVVVEANVWAGLERLGWRSCPEPVSLLDCVVGDLAPGASATVWVRLRVTGPIGGGFGVTSNGPPYDLEHHNNLVSYDICIAGSGSACGGSAPDAANPPPAASTAAGAPRPGAVPAAMPSGAQPAVDISPTSSASSPSSNGAGRTDPRADEPTAGSMVSTASQTGLEAWWPGVLAAVVIVLLATTLLLRSRVRRNRTVEAASANEVGEVVVGEGADHRE